MKLPIVSRKKYETVKENLKNMNEARQAIYKEYIKLQEEYKYLHQNHVEIMNKMEMQELVIGDYKKETKRLKTLCTKNGIAYKKEEK